jgi:D-beta-D-heptose 7-phosphate kinase/D-beta-D-heptose 1-phosphate adenosyltransferase
VVDNLNEAIRLIEHNWSNLRLLVVGDIMLDKYIWGEVKRISPEAPVPVVRATHRSEQPGGAANVAMNLARLGAQVTVLGFTGGDSDEQLLDQHLRTNDVTPAFVSTKDFPTITKLRILGGHQQIVRLDSESLGVHPAEDHARLLQLALQTLPGTHAVVLSDYAKGALNQEVCQKVIKAARDLGIPVLVDPKSADFACYRGATTICPNLRELSAAAHMDATDLGLLLDAAESMVAEFDLQFLTVTLSEKGIALLRSGSRFMAPAVARSVFDVSGAGDTVIAVLALSLASGLRPETGAQLANLAAGIVVGKVGTAPVEKHELLAALTQDKVLRGEEKVVSLDQLAKRAACWKSNGERVVFTNGCFDLLHVGHITVLDQARRFGDRLIVAINSDESVRALKGPSRPIVSETERARVLAALSGVDAVVVFSEPTPLQVILALRPDVIVKGGDYEAASVVGAQEMQTWGGQVKIVPTVEGFSTTRLIEKSAER